MSTSKIRTLEALAPNARVYPYLTTKLRRRGDEIRIRDVASAFWSEKWIVLALIVTSCLVAAALTFVLPKEYQGTVVLLPVSGTSGGGLTGGARGALAQLGGELSALGGLTLPSDERKSKAVAVLQSDGLTQRYIRDNSLLPILFGNLWDPVGKRWNVRDPKDTPTPWKANQKFKHDIRTVKTDAKTGLVTLTITWRDPRLAATWANDLVALTNDYLRTKAITQSERNVAYLTKAAESTTSVEAKGAIYSLMKNEVNEVMLAKGTDEYAFEVLDAATTPERAVFPKMSVFLLIGLATGFLFSVVLVSYRADWI